jgi:hypothetical protein
MLSGKFNFGLHHSNVTPTLREAQIELCKFSEMQLIVQKYCGTDCSMLVLLRSAAFISNNFQYGELSLITRRNNLFHGV